MLEHCLLVFSNNRPGLTIHELPEFGDFKILVLFHLLLSELFSLEHFLLFACWHRHSIHSTADHQSEKVKLDILSEVLN